MPKYRKTWTKTLDSFDFNEMPDDFCRVVWLLLPLILDSEGRGIDLPAWVRSRMFPLRRVVDEADIKRAFDFFESRKMIVRYKVDGRSYFYSVNWTSYQSGTEKESPSLLPPPPSIEKEQSGEGQEPVKSLSGGDQAEVGAAESASASESVNASEFEFVQTPFTKMNALVSNKICLTRENSDPDRWDAAINQLVTDEITEADIDAAVTWLTKAGRTILGAQSIVKACAVEKSKRERNGRPKQSDADFEAAMKAAADEYERDHPNG